MRGLEHALHVRGQGSHPGDLAADVRKLVDAETRDTEAKHDEHAEAEIDACPHLETIDDHCTL